MHKSKFITLLRSLNKEEAEHLAHYLKCHHSEQKVALSIYDFVQRLHPDLPPQQLNKRFAFERIFPGEVYHYRRISDGVQKLYVYLRDFLIWREMEQKPLGNEYLYLQILKNRQLDELFFKQIRQLKKKLNEFAFRDELTYLWQFLINHEHFFHTNTRKFDTHIPSLEEAMAGLDEFFLIAKLKLSTEMMSRRDMVDEQPPILFLEPLLKQVEKTSYRQRPLQKGYALIAELLEAKHRMGSRADEIFYEVKQIVSDETVSLGKEDRQILTLHLVNFAAWKIRQGHSQYFPEALELYQAGLQNGALLEDGYLSSVRFLNIIDVACNLQDYEWAETFIHFGSPFIAEADRGESVQVGEARLSFARGAFDQCIAALRNVSVKKPLLSLRVRSLYLRAFVELNENRELILANCQAFEKSLKRNKVISTPI
ncbi:MAG: hypothetical protein KDD04_07900, partial [Sinomicrobium sp.]|nr:hypothetical protein [Sinomicrobium sp.]